MVGGRSNRKGVNLPASIADQIGGSDFNDAEWRKTHNIGGKRKSRKETRKEQRQSKRIKRMPMKLVRETQARLAEPDEPAIKRPTGKPPASKSRKVPAADSKKPAFKEKMRAPFLSAHEEELRQRDHDDAQYYAKKLGLKSLKLSSRDDDGMNDFLSDLDLDNLAGGESGNFTVSNSGSESGVYESESASDSDGEEMTAEQTMAKLAALKAKKSGGKSTKESNRGSGLRIVREDDLGASDDSFSDDDFGSGSESSSEEEMTAKQTMAKLAALKATKAASSTPASSKSASFEADDSLSESDFEDLSDGSNGDDEMTAEQTMAKLAALKGKKIVVNELPEDDSLDENDFDSDEQSEDDDAEMTAEETMQKLAALKAKKVQKGTDISESEADMDDTSDSESGGDDNPYLPPSKRARDNAGNEESPTAKASEVMASGSDVADSESVARMKRVFKSALNRLTESTFNHVVNEIEVAFSKNSRAEASEVLTGLLLENTGGSQPLQHSYFTVYAGLIAALYSSMGTSFAASFIQALVEEIMKPSEPAINFIALLGECYMLNVVASRLVYDIIKDRLQNVTTAENESYVEQVLVLIRNNGSSLRTDDPLALKEVILFLQQRISSLGGTEALPARMRFLVDTIIALKNNRQKPVSELVVALRQRLRKSLQASSKGGAKEPLQVGLSDILNVGSKGKWWLVGASWKGNQDRDRDGAELLSSIVDDEDDLGSSAPDWLELAKKQRLNTDARRAVFVALMGAEDYLEACMRLDKLGLKNKQERDIPHVILHCLSQEPVYNPYYALVAGKQCTRHSTRMTFQFRLFDWLDSQPVGNTQTAMHYGRFYASLVFQKVLGLQILKAVDFLSTSEDVRVFLEIFFVTLYRDLGKQAEKDTKKRHQEGLLKVDKQTARDGRELTLLISKTKNEKVLRGIQLVTPSVIASEAIKSERDRGRIVWCAELASDMIDELIKRGGLVDDEP